MNRCKEQNSSCKGNEINAHEAEEDKKMENKELNLEELEKISGGFDRSLSKQGEKSDDGGIIVWVIDKIKGLFD